MMKSAKHYRIAAMLNFLTGAFMFFTANPRINALAPVFIALGAAMIALAAQAAKKEEE